MKTLITALLVLIASNAWATGEAQVRLDLFPSERMHDKVALQNGAKIFANYCLSCHSANLMRWNRLRDIGLEDEKLIKKYLIFGNQKPGDSMTVALNPKDAKLWFGKTPPDLSVIIRARTSFEHRGADYIYTLLRGYYRDASTPTGWNNVVFPNIGMPNIFWQRNWPRTATLEKVSLEAVVNAAGEPVKDAHGQDKEEYVRTVSIYDAEGNANVSRSTLEHGEPDFSFNFQHADSRAALSFDSDVADLVAFLVFMTEPGADSRVRIGAWALIFLTVFTACAWWLNRVYWKDIK